MKFQDDISFRKIKDAKFQSPKFTKRAITQKYHMNVFFFSPNIIFIIPSGDTCFFLALILFEIRHLQNFITCFSKGRNFTRGDNSEKILVCYFSMCNPYMKFKAISRCPIHTYLHTCGQPEINMLPTFTKFGA